MDTVYAEFRGDFISEIVKKLAPIMSQNGLPASYMLHLIQFTEKACYPYNAFVTDAVTFC